MKIIARLQRFYRRLQVFYTCNRRRGKSSLEIVFGIVSEQFFGKSVSATLYRIFVSKEHLRTEQAFMRVLHVDHTKNELWKQKKLTSRQFFIDPTDTALWDVYVARFPGSVRGVLRNAEAICRHEFELLGTGICFWGHPIDWHLDPKSDYRWPKTFYTALYPLSTTGQGVDVKLPYELSRMQHLPTLGKAYCLTKDERYAQELVEQISHWLIENPCHVGVNWACAMDVAIRIVNILWGLVFVEESAAITIDFKKRLFASVWEHGQYLVRHLEFGIRSDGTIRNHNHYLANIVGLTYLGILFPEFKAAEIWRRIGVAALIKEMEQQVYTDGVDYESSTSYHRLVLELFTSASLLCRLNNVTLSNAFWSKLEKMYNFTLYVTRPDGKVPQVGDADDGRLHILSEYGMWDRTDHRYLLSIGAVLFNRADMKAMVGTFSEEAFWLLGPAGGVAFDAIEETSGTLGSMAFADAGFYLMRSDKNYLLACCNPVGTAETGNHKHNDLLSYEFYADGHAFIVDPGTYIYTAAPEWRNCFRSTSYHNTVVIDQQEQNRFWLGKIFRLVPDAKPIVHQWESTSEADRLDVEHTGYQRFTCPVSHRRMFYFDKRTNRVSITDTLQGTGAHTADWYWHFDYGVTVQVVEEYVFMARVGETMLYIRVLAQHPLVAEMQDGWVSRQYGIKLPAKILQLRGIFSEYCKVEFTMDCRPY
jgi:hypothetical protein